MRLRLLLVAAGADASLFIRTRGRGLPSCAANDWVITEYATAMKG